MPDDAGSEWTVSDEDLTRLTELFCQFEGASDPRAVKCREAEAQFNFLLTELYQTKVTPRFQSISFRQFRSFTRNHCRIRSAKMDPPFPCV